MWKQVKDLAVPEASQSADSSTQHGGDKGGGDGRGSLAMAGVAQAAMAAAATAKRKTKKPRPQTPPRGGGAAEMPPPPCGEGDSGCAGGGEGRREDRESSGHSEELESSKPRLLGDTGDGNGSSSKGMRQESYYLRGAIEADRDRDLLATIAECIPGTVQYVWYRCARCRAIL